MASRKSWRRGRRWLHDHSPTFVFLDSSTKWNAAISTHLRLPSDHQRDTPSRLHTTNGNQNHLFRQHSHHRRLVNPRISPGAREQKTFRRFQTHCRACDRSNPCLLLRFRDRDTEPLVEVEHLLSILGWDQKETSRLKTRQRPRFPPSPRRYTRCQDCI